MNAETSPPLVSMMRQRGQRAAAELVGQLRGALQQPGVEVEDVAGVGLAARRAAQQQRQLAVGVGLLGQVVVDDQARARPCTSSSCRSRRRRRGRCTGTGPGDDAGRRHDDRVLHRAGLRQAVDDLGDRRALLPDRDVDALDLLLGVARGPVLALVDDRVDRDRGLADLAVADDQLALPAADRRHRVDGLDAGLQRLLHRLAVRPADGACTSRPRRPSSLWSSSGPLPSSGWPSGSTTRPR